MMKGMLFFGLLMLFAVFINFMNTFYSNENYNSFKGIIMRYGWESAMKFSNCSNEAWLYFEAYMIAFYSVFIIFAV